MQNSSAAFYEVVELHGEHGRTLLDFAFPQHFDSPARSAQAGNVPLVARTISLQLLLPERAVSGGESPRSAVRVKVPPASMDEYNDLVSWQYDVGPAGQLAGVEAKSIPEPVQDGSHNYFGLGVLSAYAAHYLASPRSREHVHSRTSPRLARRRNFLHI